MTTHVDGAVPSVAPDPGDGNPDDGILDDGGPGRHPSEFDDGSQWIAIVYDVPWAWRQQGA